MKAARAPDPAALMDALRDVHDPCCAERGVSIVDMGIVEDVRMEGTHVRHHVKTVDDMLHQFSCIASRR